MTCEVTHMSCLCEVTLIPRCCINKGIGPRVVACPDSCDSPNAKHWATGLCGFQTGLDSVEQEAETQEEGTSDLERGSQKTKGLVKYHAYAT